MASQIAGENVRGEIFNRHKYNTIKSQELAVDISFTLEAGQQTLHLSELIVRTTHRTASASELLINALRPHINVKVVGEKTVGKPIGMKVVGLCDEVIFAATQQNINSQYEGDYFDGIEADCQVADEFSSTWGDQSNDNILNSALKLIENGHCD